MFLKWVTLSWFATIPIWLEIMCTCRALLVVHTWGGMLKYESEICLTLIKSKGLSTYISLWVTPPITRLFWIGTSFEFIYTTCLFRPNWYIRSYLLIFQEAKMYIDVWHVRLEQTSFSKMQHIPNCKHLLSDPFSCQTCIMAKVHKFPFNKSHISTIQPFQVIPIDL